MIMSPRCWLSFSCHCPCSSSASRLMLGPHPLNCFCCGCCQPELLLLMSEAISADQHACRQLDQHLAGDVETLHNSNVDHSCEPHYTPVHKVDQCCRQPLIGIFASVHCRRVYALSRARAERMSVQHSKYEPYWYCSIRHATDATAAVPANAMLWSIGSRF